MGLIENSYQYYLHQEINKNNIQKLKEHKRIISVVYRFFRALNYMKKNEEEFVREYFKNRNDVVNSFCEKINKIYEIQSKRIIFSEHKVKALQSLPAETKYINIRSNIKSFNAFSWKINVTISNNNSIRVC